ncbi:HTH_Tnp_Tc3_2 domain-containing protein [Trichonephila clavipes]|nr:HTH_Tnp_Tc3_2 domain-containing protein [Trichonephila clavipes]
MNPDLSLSADDHRTRVWSAPASGPIRHLLSERHTAISQGAIYQQDNARPHTARLSQQCLQGYDVLPWPARSPDLSPIEHVLDAGKATAAVPEIQERINCADAKTMGRIFHRGHKLI